MKTTKSIAVNIAVNIAVKIVVNIAVNIAVLLQTSTSLVFLHNTYIF